MQNKLDSATRFNKKILIVVFGNAARDPRVHRQIIYLKDKFEITVAAFEAPAVEGVEFWPIKYVRASGYAQKLHRGLSSIFGSGKTYLKRFKLGAAQSPQEAYFDLVICNDALPLPFAFELGKGAPVLFEAHEFYPAQRERSLHCLEMFYQRFLKKLCHAYIPKCAGITTVCSGLANEYKRVFGVLPLVVRSIPPRQELFAQTTAAGVIRLVHHGAAGKARRIELMLELMNLLDERFTLDLMLVGKGDYYEHLRKLALSTPRVNWLDPVPMQDLCSVTNKYDLGLFLVPPTTFNLRHCLPNKFFEFIQARLGIAIGPSPEMARLVKQYDLGVVADDFTPMALASKLNALTKGDVLRFKQNAELAANELNAENEMKVFENYLETILQQHKHSQL